MITVLAGGTGSVKIVRGFVSQESKVNVISNVGDNYWMHGLYICPDIDTIVYGLADLLDQEKGWGIKKDTFNFLRQMEVFGEDTWFRIGDRDAATNLNQVSSPNTSIWRKKLNVSFLIPHPFSWSNKSANP